MAKKVANGVNKRHRKSGLLRQVGLEASKRNFSTVDRKFRGSAPGQIIREWVNNPAVKYVAGGVAAAVLARLAMNIAEKYPELSRFLKENVETLEDKLGQYRSGFGGRETGESRI